MLPDVRARFAPLVLIAVIALAACDGSGSGNDPSSPVPTSPVSSSGSVPPVTITHSGPPQPTQPTVPADVPTTGPNLRKPGERPPVMPLEATQHTQDGAVAFAKFFIQTIDWAYATTSTTYMRHYFQPGCVTCKSIQAGIDDAAAKHRHFQGDRITVTGVRSVRPDRAHSGEVSLLLAFDVTSFQVLDASGQFVDGAPALQLKNRLWLAWLTDGWTVTYVLATP
jgi:hypothetical protein